jgi:hypothetical protein
MGFFSSLFRRTPETSYRVFPSSAAKRLAYAQRLAACVADGRTVVAVYHFPDTAAELEDLLADADISCARIQQPLTAITFAELRSQPDVPVVSSDLLPQRPFGGNQEREGEREPIELALFELFPIPAPDERVFSTGERVAAAVECTAYLALDEPLMALYNGAAVVEKMGLQEDEELSHPWLGRSIRNAQRKVAATLRAAPADAASAAAWPELNLPQSS